jgi:hypothetical protein
LIVRVAARSVGLAVHLNINQSVIQRMAGNSTACKAWCITLVSAILVVVADKGKPHYALIAIIPVILFLALDVYYLSLEKMFRSAHNAFIDKLHKGGIVAADLYHISPKGSVFQATCSSLISFSIWPFYLTLGLMIWIAEKIVL